MDAPRRLWVRLPRSALALFFFLAFLEGCGYMARVAFIMDRIFRKFGLSGKSFIPMLIGAGCGVPAVMASRTIENERDRRMTIMTTTFIPCGAKLPIIGLIAGALFGRADQDEAVKLARRLNHMPNEAAYRYGSPWLSEVKEVIWSNYKYICDEFSAHLPEVRMTPLEATYLAWADFSAYLAPEEVQPFMQDKCQLAFDYGSWFGGNKSGSFIRINLATSRENIEEAVGRIVSALI